MTVDIEIVKVALVAVPISLGLLAIVLVIWLAVITKREQTQGFVRNVPGKPSLGEPGLSDNANRPG